MTYIEVLREKRLAVVAEIETLRAEATAIATRIATKESQLHNLEDLLSLESDANAPILAGADRSAAAHSQRFIDAAYESLKADGKPLHYRSLSLRLSEAGVYVPGKDPAANLLAHMSRDQRFGRASGRGVYGLVEWPAIKTSAQGRRTRVRKPTNRRRERTTHRG